VVLEGEAAERCAGEFVVPSFRYESNSDLRDCSALGSARFPKKAMRQDRNLEAFWRTLHGCVRGFTSAQPVMREDIGLKWRLRAFTMRRWA
jgi:hypothetical protein